MNLIKYFSDAKWTGFKGKTLFQWLNILGVFAVPLLIGMLSLQQGENAEKDRKAQQEIVEEKQRHEIMTNYLQQMTQLMLKHKLTSPDATEEVRTVARAITLNASRQLDGSRKALLLKFLYEAKLIRQCQSAFDPSKVFDPLKAKDLKTAIISSSIEPNCQKTIVKLSDVKLEETKFDSPIQLTGVDLTKASLVNAELPNVGLNNADIQGSNLMDADLSGAFLIKALMNRTILRNANLQGASLQGARLDNADLRNAKLQTAILKGTHFEFADLKGADLTQAQWEGASFQGATYNLQPGYQSKVDGEELVKFSPTQFPEGFNPKEQGMILEICDLGECNPASSK